MLGIILSINLINAGIIYNASILDYSYTNTNVAVSNPTFFTDNNFNTYSYFNSSSNLAVYNALYLVNYSISSLMTNFTGNKTNCFRNDYCGGLLKWSIDSETYIPSGVNFDNQLIIQCKLNSSSNWETITNTSDTNYWGLYASGFINEYFPKGQNGSWIDETYGCNSYDYDSGSSNSLRVIYCNGGQYFPIPPNCSVPNSIMQIRYNMTATKNTLWTGLLNFNTKFFDTTVLYNSNTTFVENSQTFNSNTQSGNLETFIINITTDNLFTLNSSILRYNNTNYNATSINSLGNGNYIISTSLIVPNVTASSNKV